MKTVNRLSRNLIYLLFVVLVVYLLSLRAQRGKTVILGEWPLEAIVQEAQGVVVVKQRGDGSQVLIVKLARAFPQTKILVETKEGLFRELGIMQGATFVTTLPEGIRLQDMRSIRLQGPDERILAETSFKTP